MSGVAYRYWQNKFGLREEMRPHLNKHLRKKGEVPCRLAAPSASMYKDVYGGVRCRRSIVIDGLDRKRAIYEARRRL